MFQKMYIIQFAPDGENFFTIAKSKDTTKIWNKFNLDLNITLQKALNKFARFRLINLDSGKIIIEK